MTVDEKQLQNNVEYILDMYYNQMMDYDDPPMTKEECREYCTSQIYDIKSDGCGYCKSREGICDNLRFLGNEYIYKVIDEYAADNGILIEDE